MFSAGTIAVSLLGEPIGSSIMAYFLFDERLTAPKLIGGGLILFAIYLASRGRPEKREMNPVDKAVPMLYSTPSRVKAASGDSAFQAFFRRPRPVIYFYPVLFIGHFHK